MEILRIQYYNYVSIVIHLLIKLSIVANVQVIKYISSNDSVYQIGTKSIKVIHLFEIYNKYVFSYVHVFIIHKKYIFI